MSASYRNLWELPADALGKLQGFTEYAERYGEHFERIEVATGIAASPFYLDIKDQAVRSRIVSGNYKSVQDLFAEYGKRYV